jgi:uncharacterized protein
MAADLVRSVANVATETPARYLGQLCKHFEHKLEVTHERDHGRIVFPMGTCLLATEGETLVLRAEAEDQAALERLQDVVARHLLRFAFRAPPEIVWQKG